MHKAAQSHKRLVTPLAHPRSLQVLSRGPAGVFSLSPTKMRFVLYLNMSYANMALTEAQAEAFLSDLMDVVVLAFQVGEIDRPTCQGG